MSITSLTIDRSSMCTRVAALGETLYRSDDKQPFDELAARVAGSSSRGIQSINQSIYSRQRGALIS